MPAGVLLREFTLSVSLETFVDAFWLNRLWYEKFLVEKLKDIDVSIEDWVVDGSSSGVRHRKVRCFHPSGVSFPGLPSHAEVIIMIILGIEW
jgi:hypothetical protein